MSSAKITLIGFYKMFDTIGDDLFKNLSLPTGIDKETLVDNILLRGGEFEVLYSDPDFLQNAVGSWSNKWNRTFTRWVEAQALEYNPLENYDRMETWTDNGSTSASDQQNGTGTSNATNTVSAFNSSEMQNDSGNTSNTTSTNTSTTNATSDATHTGRIHGNVGVTTSQQMLQAEYDIARWNIYEHITDIFLSEFVIAIY